MTTQRRGNRKQLAPPNIEKMDEKGKADFVDPSNTYRNCQRDPLSKDTHYFDYPVDKLSIPIDTLEFYILKHLDHYQRGINWGLLKFAVTLLVGSLSGLTAVIKGNFGLCGIAPVRRCSRGPSRGSARGLRPTGRAPSAMGGGRTRPRSAVSGWAAPSGWPR